MKAASSSITSDLSGEQFREAMEHSPIGTALVGLDGLWKWTNIALQEMLGYTKQELARRTFQEITHSLDLGLDLENVEALLAGKSRGYQLEKRYVRKDDSLVWALLTVALIRDSLGRPDYFIAKIQDITDRKAAELERAALMERLTLATKAGGVGVWEWSIVTRRLIWDDRMHELYDVPLSVEPDLELFFSRVHDKDRERIKRELEDAVAGLRLYDTELATVSMQGGERHLRALGTVVHEDGRALRMIGTNWDVSELRRLMTQTEDLATAAKAGHDRIQALQSELIQLSRASAMSTLASAIAHEINQPLAATSNFIAAASAHAARGEVDPEKIARLLSQANTAVLRAGNIIKSLRKMLQRTTSWRAPTDMANVISEASELGLVTLLTKGVNYRQTVGTEMTFEGDGIQVQQVLLNLIKNAVDAVSNSPSPEISLTASREGTTIKVCVADTGPGVRSDVKDHLFEAFATTKPDGLGIGLSICRAIVEAHGGKIWAEDGHTGGSVFCFTVPVSSSLARAEHAASVLGSL